MSKFIGWISFSPGHVDLPSVAESMNEILKEHSGPIFSIAVSDMEYFEDGIVFATEPVPIEEVQAYYSEELAASYAEDEEEEESAV